MSDTEQLWKEYRRERRRKRDDRDLALAHEGRMSAAEFARLHGLNQSCLRIKIRKAKYKRVGNRNLIPIADLEKFL